MQSNKDYIIIMDWTGATLFEGHYDDDEVDRILDLNRCDCDPNICGKCNDTGYMGEFEIYWVRPQYHEDDNVYEFIDY